MPSERAPKIRATSIAKATSRVTKPASFVSASGSPAPGMSLWTIFSSTSSRRSVRRLIWRPMSEISPKPCWAIAARTSGASATRSTSFCALSRGEDLVPDPVGGVAVDRLLDHALDVEARGGRLDHLLEPALLGEADDRTLDRGALERPHDRLLGGGVERAVDARGAGERAARADAAAEHAARERIVAVVRRRARRSLGHRASLVRVSRRRRAAALTAVPGSPRSAASPTASRLSGQTLSTVSSVVCQYSPGVFLPPKLKSIRSTAGIPCFEERVMVVADRAGDLLERGAARGLGEGAVEVLVRVELARDLQVAVADHVEQHHRLDLIERRDPGRGSPPFAACST